MTDEYEIVRGDVGGKKKMKPCQVCGKNAALLFSAREYGCAFVECQRCGHRTNTIKYVTNQEAIDAWNGGEANG